MSELRLPVSAGPILDAEGGQDFALSAFFLPPFFPSSAAEGALEAAVFWDEVASGAAAGPDSLWLGCGLGEVDSGLALLLECPLPPAVDRERFSARVKTALGEGWKRGARRLAAIAAEEVTLRFGTLSSPPASRLEGALRASGEVRVGSGGFRFEAWLPPAFLEALGRALERALGYAFGPPAESPNAPDPRLEYLAALNEAVLGRWGAEYRDAFLRPRSPPGSDRATTAPPLAPLIAALGLKDGAIALQNCLLARYGAPDLPYLFFHHLRRKDQAGESLVPLPIAPFRDGDILRLLPDAAREEWERERSLGLPRRCVEAGEAIAANDEGAALIWRAAKEGRIELSGASRELLDAKVGSPLAAASRARLDSLVEMDVPFGPLAALSRRDLARIVGRLSNRDLALASVGDRRRIRLLEAGMGRARRRDLEEQIEIDETRLDRGEIEVDAVAAAKSRLHERLLEMIQALEGEKAQAAVEAGPRPASRYRYDEPEAAIKKTGRGDSKAGREEGEEKRKR